MICYNNIFITDVHRVTKAKDPNEINQDAKEYKAKNVIVATRSPWRPSEAGRDTRYSVVALNNFPVAINFPGDVSAHAR